MLFGPRGSGKSTFLKDFFSSAPKPEVWIDLLNAREEDLFQAHPEELLERTQFLKPGSWVVIDEIQKVPRLLDSVHKLIEDKKILFALSGSSARKLKRGSANLLAGRAFVYHLFPFTSIELKNDFFLNQTLQFGSLPKILEFQDDVSKKLFLQAYADTYLREEIQMEQIVRNLPAFRRFLEVAAQMNGQPISYSKIGRDIFVDHSAVRNYFEILEDTLVGFQLPAYERSLRKQQRQAPKFYLFDCGVKKALEKTLEIPPQAGTYEYGHAFEHFIVLEFYKLCKYRKKDEELFYLRTKDGLEVDLIMTRPGKNTLFIEIKSTSSIRKEDVSALLKITADQKNTSAFVVSLDKTQKSFSHVMAYHWKDFLDLFLNKAL